MEENFLFGTRSIIISNIKIIVLLIAIFTVSFVLLNSAWDSDQGLGLQGLGVQVELDDVLASHGSVTSCIELDAIANEIEITKSSIEKAARKIHDFLPHFSPDSEEAPKYCALKLV
ncbi:hypothetical protein [Agarilytica rhodophyticola]|uniref:hypothetical protein n=1 Tax=Agarilytica rhodophyticola TaxID=1737490 RepID=UPI000B345CA1|nr:hypothetical protein [Agarilytica rhodophyticola]